MRNAFLCCFLITSAFGQDPASDEGLLPVFRCVLDERPRMLVILLGEKQDQALAFHTESGTLWKAWKAEEGKTGRPARRRALHGQAWPAAGIAGEAAVHG